MQKNIKYETPEIVFEKFQVNDELMNLYESEVDTAPFFFSNGYREQWDE